MKTQYSITELAEKVEEHKKAKVDYIATTNALNTFVDPKGEVKMQIALEEESKELGINDHAHSQIGSRLNIPRNYYKKMLQEAPGLLTENANHWLSANPERRMVRTMFGDARAFLSDRYHRIENDMIAEVVLPELAKIEEVSFESTAITEKRMYIKAVTPKVQAKVVGDIVYSGVAISNSEVGAGAIKVEPLVYTLACTNGMILNDARYRAAHIGGRVGNDEAIAHMLSDETIAADDSAILLKVRDVVRTMIDEEMFSEVARRLEETEKRKLGGDITASVEVLGQKVGLNQTEQSSVLRHLIEGGRLTQYGMLNAVTRTAQDIESYDRATEIETIGGKIMDMSERDWEQIAAA